MIHYIRTSKFSKIVASYLAIQLILTTIQPSQLFALTGGPSQPEFNAFTPIGTSDMVSLTSGDFNYNIPIMDVGGYPLNLAYNSGISMDQEASWVGLGWNLNIGQINRNVRGLPDDFNGDELIYENNLKKNKTVGITLSINGQLVGAEEITRAEAADGASSTDSIPSLDGSFSTTLIHNNYEGFSFSPTFGVSFNFAKNTSVGMNLTSSVSDGVSVSPTATQSFNAKDDKTKKSNINGLSHSLGIGTTLNSRQGITSFNINQATRNNKAPKDNGININTSANLSFIDNTFTPNKRNAYHNENYTFRASIGPNAWPINAEFGASAFMSQQSLKEKVTTEKAYGYEFTDNASKHDILDFNKENERIVDKNTRSLPVVNYTYDLYQIQGQGIAGQFRPYKSQVGYIFNPLVTDSGYSFSAGGEFQIGIGGHNGVDVHFSPTESHTGVWDLPVLNKFRPATNNPIDYEPTYFKGTGDLSIDDDEYYDGTSGDSTLKLFKDKLSGETPMHLDLEPNGKKYHKKAVGEFHFKKYNEIDFPIYDSISIASPLKRQHREKRNQAIAKFTKNDAQLDPFLQAHDNLKPHHTNGIKIVQPDGSRYVYGEVAVNTKKEEVTFAAGEDNMKYLDEGTIEVRDQDNPGNNEGVDHYFNRITTPSYAHTYLLTSVLSTDYEDRTGDGPTDDDFGAYTKIHYNDFSNDTDEDGELVTGVSNQYGWKVPYNSDTEEDIASYNPGLYTKGTSDQKGNYVQGVKELKYATKIETKTHVAVFDFKTRDDGNGTKSGDKMLQVSKIKLYSKPEYQQLIAGDTSITPIKTAHFTYDNSLMSEVPNNSADTGKLTLKEVYFTYRGSQMGKYTPYTFNYDNYNPNYQLKSYDIWGNYKPLFEEGVSYDETADGKIEDFSLSTPASASCESKNSITAQEFPFVQQNSKALQDYYASAWTLSSVDLPSGGRIEIEFESDDYQYVQDKKAMQMFKVVGASNNDGDEIGGDLLWTSAGAAKYLTIELLDTDEVTNVDEFKSKYVGEYIDNPLFFRFLLNMEKDSNCSFDFVEGYCTINKDGIFKFFTGPDGKRYGSIPIELVKLEGGVTGAVEDENPIAKSGWFFAREHLNRFAHGTGDTTPSSTSLGDIIDAIGSNLAPLAQIFNGPNGHLKSRGIAKEFVPEKSWIRLRHPSKAKLGGGVRVKTVKMYDNWDKMVDNPQTNPINAYSNFYGQEYSYELDNDLGSSGVATWEPNMSKENPLIQPFFDAKEKLQARAYVEKPFGKSFYPSPTITYSRVKVNNLSRVKTDGAVIKRHATGYVINEFYTSKDFPTQSDHTKLDGEDNYKTDQKNLLDNALKLNVNTELALSQGFSVVTNDMNGKSKHQKIFDEYDSPISSVEYIYNVTEDGNLNNELPVVLEDGTIENQSVGIQYDVITDFNENYNLSETFGANVNLTYFVIPPAFPVFLGQTPFEYKRNESTLHTTTTTKVVHKTGILIEKVATDLGASVRTKNLAWDAVSGQVLLTETSNEYNDNYYNFSYPAHWMYKGMGQATTNLGISMWISPTNSSEGSDPADDEEGATALYRLSSAHYTTSHLFENFLAVGDEVYLYSEEGGIPEGHYWIGEILSGNRLMFIDVDGNIANACGDDETTKLMKVVRSSYRNLQSAAMASVTSMQNPMTDNIINEDDFEYGTGANPKIINASAVEYSDYWLNPEENPGIKRYPSQFGISDTELLTYPNYYSVNPFVHNVKGEWRAVKSYAHLTGRTANENTRNDGVFTSFSTFYKYNDDVTVKAWEKNDTNWTFASEVTQYSPYGAELENKDALGRFSSAQYGYDYKLPVAVASNSAYRQMGYEGFEDQTEVVSNTHFTFSDISSAESGVSITDAEAHTGRYSIKVSGGQSKALSKRLYNNCIELAQQLDCAPIPCPCGEDSTGECITCPDANPICANVPYGTDIIINETGVLGTIGLAFYYGPDGPSPNTACGGSLEIKTTSGVFTLEPLYDSSSANHQVTPQFQIPLTGIHVIRIEISDSDESCHTEFVVENGTIRALSSGDPVPSATQCYTH